MKHFLRIWLTTQTALSCGLGFSQNWKQVGDGLSCNGAGSIYELHTDTVNDLLLGRGWLSLNTNCDTVRNAVVWDGNNWERLGEITPTGMGFSIGTYNGQVISQGMFWGSNVASYLGIWNGSAWDSIPNGPNTQSTWAIEQFGDWLYIGGTFSKCGGDSTKLVCRWNGSEWEKLVNYYGEGDYANGKAIAVYKDTLYLGGNYDGNAMHTGRANNLSSVYDLELHQVGVGLNSSANVEALCVHNDTLWVGGTFLSGNFEGVDEPTHLLTYCNGELKPYHTQPPSRVTGLKSYKGNLYMCGWFHHDEVDEPEWAGCMNVGMIHNGKAYCLSYDPPYTTTFGQYDAGLRDIEIWKDTLYVGGDAWAFGDTPIRNVAYLDWSLSNIMNLFTPDEPTDTIATFLLFPNPASATITIESPVPLIELEIFDVLGKQVFKSQLSINKVELNVEHISMGCYICNIHLANGEVFTKKFLKQ